MRRCKAVIVEDRKRVPVEGLFHQWANDFEDCGEAGIGNYTVAIIELDDGRIVEGIPNTVVFTEPACLQPTWWMRVPAMPAVKCCENSGKPCKKTYPFSSYACGNWVSRWVVGVDTSTEPDKGGTT